MEKFKFKCGCEIDMVDGKPNIDFNNLRLDCPKTWEIYQKGYTNSVFQLNSYLGKKYSKELQPENILDAANLIAIIRPACISHDTKIFVKRYKSSNKKKLVTISYLFKNKHKYKEIFSLNQETNKLVKNKIKDVLYNGKKRCYKLTLSRYNEASKRKKKYGFSISNLKCTQDHKIYTQNGWKQLKDLDLENDRVAVLKTETEKTRKLKKDILDRSSRSGGRVNNTEGAFNYRQLCYENYEYKCCICGWQNASLDVHHIDGNRYKNNKLENLCFMCPNHHREADQGLISKDKIKNCKKQCELPYSKDIVWSKIISIEDVGYEDVYDISMDFPHHNFIAGNVIVHNCLQSKDDNGISLTQKFCNIKNGFEELDPDNPLSKVASETYSILIFQETVILLAVDLAGFSSIESLKFMKTMAKKDAAALFAYEEQFLEGCSKKGVITSKEAKHVFDDIKNASRYLFNKCLAGTEEILLADGSKKTIAELFKNQDKLFGISFRETSETFKKNKIEKITYQGKKQTFKVTTTSGRSVIATANHKFPTNHGEKKVEDLKLGDQFLIYENDNENFSYESVINIAFGVEEDVYDVTMRMPYHNFVLGSNIVSCNSHSVGYAILGHQMAWAIAHLPKHFICAQLMHAKDAPSTQEEIRKISSEARRLSLNIKPPSAKNLPFTDFFIKENDIYFALNSIKSCSDKTFTKINKLNIKLEDLSWPEFLTLHSDLFNKTQIKNMIRTGCFDFMNISRRGAEYEYDQWNLLTKTEKTENKKLFKNGNYLTLLDLLEDYEPKEKRKAFVDSIKYSLLKPPTDLDDSIDNIVNNERQLLGVNLSCSKVEKGSVPKMSDKCADVESRMKEYYLLVGEISEYREFKIKNGKMKGQFMASFKLNDEEGDCDVVCFPSQLERFESCLFDSNVCVVDGKISSRGNSLILNEIHEI